MNWLIDREYIAQEIYRGLAVPRYLPITSAFPDYARLAHIAKKLEIRYAYNPEKAKEIITEEMEKLGAKLIDGKWYYREEPVTIIFLIRVEDERRAIGDYVATLLENLGFVVDRQYKTAAEASPIWIGGNPADGRWHIYTAAWITTVVDRDQGSNFSFFYTPRGAPDPLWQAYTPSPEFDEVADRLDRADYKTLEERQELFARALELALQDSVRVWLVDTISFWGRRKDVAIAADLAGGISGSWLWPHTIRRLEQTGGIVKIALPNMLPSPWNPIGGSNWIFDTMLYRATGDLGLLPDPFTGLMWPQRIERAEVFVKEGLPVTKTLDWVDLKFVPEIQVPADAWIDWDATAQRFITVGEKYPAGLTANRKSVVYYPKDLYKLKWHDGSTLSLGDIVLGVILTFDRAKPESLLFDEAEVPSFESFVKHFRGFRIASKDPLVLEYYSDLYFLDAELNVATFYPYYSFGPGAWHSLAVGMRAEMEKELAFTSAKADRLGIEWMSYIAGPSLSILEKHLNRAKEENFIPYAPTLSKYISTTEAQERWTNLQRWYQAQGHFWVGMGPFYLDSVRPIEKILVLKRFAEFPDPAEEWLRFTEPWIAEVNLQGPAQVQSGTKAEFLVEVTFKGEAYPIESVDFVRYLVLDAHGEVALIGVAEPIRDGLWRIALTAEETAHLKTGSNRLEVVVAPLRVSIPSFESLTFVTTP
jgi:peptide/nickel transport system substrate-binding protein